jgi:hypothetical protein
MICINERIFSKEIVFLGVNALLCPDMTEL